MRYYTRKTKNYFGTLNLQSKEDRLLLGDLRREIGNTNIEIREDREIGKIDPENPLGREYSLKVFGRGPRKEAEMKDGVAKGRYGQYLPIRHAIPADVYINQKGLPE